MSPAKQCFLALTIRQPKTFFKKWAIPDGFLIYFWVFLKKHYNFTTDKSEKKFILYTVLGFKLTSFRIFVSSHNHQTSCQSLSINYDSRFINVRNLQVITTLVVIYERKMFIRLATGLLPNRILFQLCRKTINV